MIKFHDVIYNYLSYDNVSFREKYNNKEKKIKTKNIYKKNEQQIIKDLHLLLVSNLYLFYYGYKIC